MAIGCLLFYPAAEYRNFNVFLVGYFTLAAGITVLQVAANPYVALLGSEDGASSRLNLSQAFNSLGNNHCTRCWGFILIKRFCKNI